MTVTEAIEAVRHLPVPLQWGVAFCMVIAALVLAVILVDWFT